MVSVAPSESRKHLVKMAKNLALQPILFIRALPYVTAQLSTYGVSFLKRPVIWMALGIHGVLLVLPAIDLSAPKVEEVIEPEPEEEVSIEAVSLSDILAPTEPVPPPPEEPQAPPPETPPPAAVIAPPVLTEVPEQLEEIIEEPQEEFEEEFEEEEFEEEEQSFGFDPAQQAALGGSLSQLLGVSDAGSDNFDTTDIWFSIDPSDQRKLDWRADDIASITDKTAFFTPESITDGTYFAAPDITFRVIDRSADLIKNEGLGLALTQQGMTLNPDGQYGGYTLYGIYDANQQIVNYLSLVPFATGGSRTFVFVWPSDPRQG